MPVTTIPGVACSCGHAEFYTRGDGSKKLTCAKCRAPFELIPKEESLTRAPSESKCKGCGAPIRWIKMVSEKSMPVNAKQQNFIVLTGDNLGEMMKGWVPHWATCPKREKFSKK